MRHVAVTASTDPGETVTVRPARYDDRFTVRFGECGVDVLITPAQLEQLRVGAGLAQLMRSGT